MNLNLTKPDGLSEIGSLACDVITQFLTSRNLVSDGSPLDSTGEDGAGDPVFISPQELAEMDFPGDGWAGELVVEHSNGPHCEAFDWDRRNYTLMEDLRAELNKIECYAEQIDGSFSAIFYKPKAEHDKS